MTAPQKSGKTGRDWKKIGPCLCRYKGRAYYGLVKHKGKQIRHSLETNDLALARRRLKDWRGDLEHTDHGQSDRNLETNAAKFLPTLKGSAFFRKTAARRSPSNTTAIYFPATTTSIRNTSSAIS